MQFKTAMRSLYYVLAGNDARLELQLPVLEKKPDIDAGWSFISLNPKSRTVLQHQPALKYMEQLQVLKMYELTFGWPEKNVLVIIM